MPGMSINRHLQKMPDFIIYGTIGSEAERYAKDNGFTFRSSEGGSSQGAATITIKAGKASKKVQLR